MNSLMLSIMILLILTCFTEFTSQLRNNLFILNFICDNRYCMKFFKTYILKYLLAFVIILLLSICIINDKYTTAMYTLLGAILSVITSFAFEDYKTYKINCYWKDNEYLIFRDFTEIFSKIMTELAYSLKLIDITKRTNVGYIEYRKIDSLNNLIQNYIENNSNIVFNLQNFMLECESDFNSLTNNYFHILTRYCPDEELRFAYSLLITNINKFNRDYCALKQIINKMNVIENQNTLKKFINKLLFYEVFKLNNINIFYVEQYNELFDNIKMQIRNVSNEIGSIYKIIYPVVESGLKNNR